MCGGQGSYATDAHSHTWKIMMIWHILVILAHAHVHELVSVIIAALAMGSPRMLTLQRTEARIQNLLTALR